MIFLDLIHDLLQGVQSGAEYGGGGFPTRARFLMLLPKGVLDYVIFFWLTLGLSRTVFILILHTNANKNKLSQLGKDYVIVKPHLPS